MPRVEGVWACRPVTRNRIIELRRVRAGDLQPHDANARRHPDVQRRAVEGSLASLGQVAPLLVYQEEDGTLCLFDGHLRASLDPEAEVTVALTDLKPPEAREALALLDPSAALAEVDEEKMQALRASIHIDFDSGALQWHDGLAALIGDLNGIGDTSPTHQGDPDEVPESAPPRVKPGEIWACGPHRILCASVTDAAAVARLMDGERAATLVTSPPYYGLRAYGTEPQVWGGSSECEHDFDSEEEQRFQVPPGSDKQASNPGAVDIVGRSATCRRCGAWRGELGLERTPAEWVEHLAGIFRALASVMREDASLWINVGDSYAFSGDRSAKRSSGDHPRDCSCASCTLKKPTVKCPPGLPAKNLMGMPWRLAFALQDAGFILRSEIIWEKPAPMPESVTDRPTKAHEQVFLFALKPRYYYDAEAVREECETENWRPATGANLMDGSCLRNDTARHGGGQLGSPTGRNLRTTWRIHSTPYSEAHFAVYPVALVTPCLLAGTSAAGACPHCGAGWVRVVEREFEKTRGNAGPNIREDRTGYDNGSGRQWPLGYGRYNSEPLGGRPACTCPTHEPRPSIVLDPFLGAGTTMIAAEMHGRRAYGIELNPSYADLALARYEKFTGKVARRLYSPESDATL